MPVVRSAAARGRCGFTAGPLHNSQQIHHFITFPFLSILPSLLTPAFLQPLCSFGRPHSHPVVSLQLELLASTFKHMQMRLQTIRAWLFSPTYLSVLLQIRFISYEDHGKFISVFYSQDLSLEFVDFLKAVKQTQKEKPRENDARTTRGTQTRTQIRENSNTGCISSFKMLELAPSDAAAALL